MGDKAFERSMIILTVIVLVLVIAAIIFRLLNPFWAIISGLVLEIIAGSILLHYWGKNFMERNI